MSDNYDKIIEAISQLEKQNFQPVHPYYILCPIDCKRIHINKISFRFMKIIKRNRKLRNNGFKR